MTGTGPRGRGFSSARDWALRHPVLLTLIAAMALAGAAAARAHGWRLAGVGAVLAVLAFLLGHLRWSTMIVACWALVFVYALSEGNFGTAFRHRGELVPPTAVLAALGAPTIVRVWQERRERAASGMEPARTAHR